MRTCFIPLHLRHWATAGSLAMRGYRLRHPSVGPQALPTCTRVATPGNRAPLCAARRLSSVSLGRAVYRKGCVGQQSYQLINRHVGVPSASATSEQAASSEPHSCPRGEHWKVHKFGGTCVADAERIRNVCKLLLSDEDTKLVVTSAMGAHPASPVKVTDLLLNMVNKASKQDDAFLLDLAQLQQKHVETAKTLLGDGAELNAFISTLFEDITNLKAMLQAISIAGMATEAFTDFVVGHGELWCAQLMAATCRTMGADAEFMDTRDVLVVTPTADGASVDVQYGMSDKRLDLWYAKQSALPKLVIATGFIARNPEGQATTLKRNGSDYSATIMGALFRAGCITIWTDVDGVYSADPRKVPEAVCLTSLTYHEAWELSYFGANVLHPRTTLPAMKYGIPIMIRNFFDQASPGTLISDGTDTESPQPLDGKSSVKGFATIDHVALVNLEGTGMVGVPGVASAIFGAIRDAGVNVIMISQASSEHSVCFAVKQADGAKARQVLESRFQDSLQAGSVHSIEVIDDCCVLAAVGSGMASKKGVSATMFSALANGNINVRAIAQGCSEYNITVLIDQKESTRALRAVHGRFYLSDVAIGVAIVGPGLIGGTLLDQVKEQLEYLHNQLHVDVRVLALASSSKMLLSDSGICLDNWKPQFQAEAEPCNLERLGQHLASSYIPNTAIIDCTASDEPATFYAAWMKQGIHVITPNKKLGSGPLAQYKEVQKLRRVTSSHFFYEATVGAGLPIIGTLQHLMETGDKVLSIEGIFSGTLSYIFNTWGTDDRTFSEVVAEAKELGYTEPDPRDDLAGMDVARKVIILAREAGLNVELDDVPVASLVPDELASCETAEEFMERLPEFDAALSAQLEEAKAAGEVLRFVGVVDCQSGTGSVELRRYPDSHAFAQLKGSDNIISFTTSRYISQPLTIIGPGAGAAVTAGGVFSDFLRLASSLGGSSLF